MAREPRPSQSNAKQLTQKAEELKNRAATIPMATFATRVHDIRRAVDQWYRRVISRRRCRSIRVGHALRSPLAGPGTNDLEMVVRLLSGEECLRPRTPSIPSAVSRAERVLGIGQGVVYGFIGNLCPQLGTIGLIISPKCLNGDVHGVSRCDTGGLGGRCGSFAAVPDAEVDDKLRSISYPGTKSAWRAMFAEELGSSYSNGQAYVAGDLPDYQRWNDIRPACIEFKGRGADLNRRLWTWEVRFRRGPSYSRFEAVVLSYEAFKQLEELRAGGIEIPTRIKVAHGAISETGIRYFNSKVVFGLFLGSRSL